jgi:hypothetical protein
MGQKNSLTELSAEVARWPRISRSLITSPTQWGKQPDERTSAVQQILRESEGAISQQTQ